MGAFSLQHLFFLAIFPRGCIRARFSLFFYPFVVIFGCSYLSVRFERLQHLFLREPLHKLVDVGASSPKNLLLRLLQRGNALSKESIKPNSSKILQLFSSSEDQYSTVMVFFISYSAFWIEFMGFRTMGILSFPVSCDHWLCEGYGGLWRSLELGEDALLFSTYS